MCSSSSHTYLEIKPRLLLARFGSNLAGTADKYDEMYHRSINDPESFWGDAATGLDWYKPFDKVIVSLSYNNLSTDVYSSFWCAFQVLDDSNPPFYRWFPGSSQTD